ncbi:MAG: DUF3347 domain-containing protein, partial [Myxococcales bacterium]|nr:DUF3347 domain-containing protein [Myxococcales bacterium]
DSDLQIRGALSLMARPDDTQRGPSAPPLVLAEADAARLRPVLSGYLDVQERLAADDWAGAKARIDAWASAVAAVKLTDPVARAAWQEVARRLAPDLDALTHATAIKPARARFSLVTRAMDAFLARFGNVSEGLVRKAYCPMAADNRGDHWYQRGEAVDNVYFGNQMRRCGEIQAALDEGEHLLSPAEPVGEPAGPDGAGAGQGTAGHGHAH